MQQSEYLALLAKGQTRIVRDEHGNPTGDNYTERLKRPNTKLWEDEVAEKRVKKNEENRARYGHTDAGY